MHAHLSLPIEGEHFARWLALWRVAVDELFAGPRADDAIACAERIARVLARRLGGRGMRRAALPAVCLLWAGIAIGISFIEAPAKLQAPSLTLPVAIDVGRHVFAASHAVQLGLAALAVAAAVWARTGGAARWILAGAVAIFLGQHLAVLPALDARAAIVAAGGHPEQARPTCCTSRSRP